MTLLKLIYWYVKIVAQLLSCVQLLCDLTAAHQASQSFAISLSLPNSCTLNQWWHSTALSSVAPSPLCPPSFPSSGSFQWVSQLFILGGQNIGDSSFSTSPSNQYSGLVSLDWLDWSPLLSKGLLRVFQCHSSNVNFLTDVKMKPPKRNEVTSF